MLGRSSAISGCRPPISFFCEAEGPTFGSRRPLEGGCLAVKVRVYEKFRKFEIFLKTPPYNCNKNDFGGFLKKIPMFFDKKSNLFDCKGTLY